MSKRREPWTTQEAIEAVRAFHRERGYQPVSNEAGPHNGLPPWVTVKRLFGSWNALIEASGLRPYPARSSAQAKTMAFRDRNPNWREEMRRGVKVTHRDIAA